MSASPPASVSAAVSAAVPASGAVPPGLAELAAARAGGGDARTATVLTGSGTGDDRALVRVGDVVAKAHAADTDAALLARRVALAADGALDGILLPPLEPRCVPLAGGRAATLWPRGVPVDPGDPDGAPWEAAGELLARLHAVNVTDVMDVTGAPGMTGVPQGAGAAGPLPAMRGPERAARAVTLLRAGAAGGDARLAAARRAVAAAWSRLPSWCRGEDARGTGGRGTGGRGTDARERALCHGDFHLGQLVRLPHPSRLPHPPGAWRLIDIDDLGLGEPAWDLARPAAWFAAGLLPADVWHRLLHAYQVAGAAGGGCGALGGPGADPWPRLDAPARALTAQLAASAVERASAAGRLLDEDDEALVDACTRISRLSPGASA